MRQTTIDLIVGDALTVLKTLPDASAHVICSSPPYFALRDYQCEGQMGSESTIEEYVQNLVLVFREARRVLHPSGTIWVNLGDSWSHSGNGGGGKFAKNNKQWRNEKQTQTGYRSTKGFKPKDLIMSSFMVAEALRQDGWYLRSTIIWNKISALPSSVTDRPSHAHEYVFLLSKSRHYYYDQDAVRELTGNESTPEDYDQAKVGSFHPHEQDENGWCQPKKENFKTMTHPLGRNKRSVWSIASQPFKEAHHAVMPEALVSPMILAGTSERGCCYRCLSPYKRHKILAGQSNHGGPRKHADTPGAETSKTSVLRTGTINHYRTINWIPTCSCDDDQSFNRLKRTIPCTVLDMFSGAATVGVVANKLDRNYIGIELSPNYMKIAFERLKKQCKTPLLTKITVRKI